jgi:hypothetical protein
MADVKTLDLLAFSGRNVLYDFRLRAFCRSLKGEQVLGEITGSIRLSAHLGGIISEFRLG